MLMLGLLSLELSVATSRQTQLYPHPSQLLHIELYVRTDEQY